MRNCDSTSPPRSRHLGLSFLWDEIRRQGGPFAEEIIVHLLQQEFLRLLGAEVEPILVHEHLHVLDPHLPGFLGDVLENLLPERMALEGRLIEPFHLLLELHAKDLARSGVNRILYLVKGAAAASTSHGFESPGSRILCGAWL